MPARQASLGGPGIVYAATHASAQAAHDTLASAGEQVTLYHAGLSARERREAMTAFVDGSARIIAATVAFGMGIDKADVRWVVHVDPLLPRWMRTTRSSAVLGPGSASRQTRYCCIATKTSRWHVT